MREIGRPRELSFRSAGEGYGMPGDIDRCDRDYFQLILRDPEHLATAGAYRIGDSARLLREKGLPALYTSTLFSFGPGMQPVLDGGLELGRSAQSAYQNRQSLDLHWCGIGAFLRRYPGYRYLFGPVSISRFYGAAATARIVDFYSCHFGSDALGMAGFNPYFIQPEFQQKLLSEFTGTDREADFRALRHYLAEHGMPAPALYKHYSEAAEPGGVRFAAFNIDPDFGDCVDGFPAVDLDQLKPRKRKRYLGVEEMTDGSARL